MDFDKLWQQMISGSQSPDGQKEASFWDKVSAGNPDPYWQQNRNARDEQDYMAQHEERLRKMREGIARQQMQGGNQMAQQPAVPPSLMF